MQTSLMIVDNFYNNPMGVRNLALSKDFAVQGNYPGFRTEPEDTTEVKMYTENLIKDTAGKITDWDSSGYNGAFQYTTAQMRSWIHCDYTTKWAMVIYLTPDAPLSAGTGLFRHNPTGMYSKPDNDSDMATRIEADGQDITKWTLHTVAGNVFNRAVIYRGDFYHMSMDYFGNCLENGRLFQTFFFNTEQ